MSGVLRIRIGTKAGVLTASSWSSTHRRQLSTWTDSVCLRLRQRGQGPTRRRRRQTNDTRWWNDDKNNIEKEDSEEEATQRKNERTNEPESPDPSLPLHQPILSSPFCGKLGVGVDVRMRREEQELLLTASTSSSSTSLSSLSTETDSVFVIDSVRGIIHCKSRTQAIMCDRLFLRGVECPCVSVRPAPSPPPPSPSPPPAQDQQQQQQQENKKNIQLER